MLGRRFFQIAAVYFVIGVLLGLTMGIIQDFRLTSTHAHLNLLGWVSMAIFAAFYHFYPKAAETKLAKTHFWLHNICVPVMQGALAIEILTENTAIIPVVIVASIALIIGVILFAINVFSATSSASAASSKSNISA